MPPDASTKPPPAWIDLALMLGLCILALGPGALLDGSEAIGRPTRDLYDHVALLDAWFVRTDAWNFPDGGAVVAPDPTGMLLAAPALAMGLSRATAYDLALLGQLFAACAAAWALARRFGDGLVGGVAFGLSPYLLGQAFSGETETVAAWPLPAMVLLLEWGRDGRRFAWLGAGAVAALGAVASWYHGVFLGAVMVLWLLLRGGRRAWPAPLAFAGLVLAPAVAYHRVLVGSEQLFAGPTMGEYLALYPRALGSMVSDPSAWFGPAAAGAAHVDLLGVAIGLLAVLGLWRGGATLRWWAVVVVVGLVLALGPAVYVRGAEVWAWAPGRLLADLPLVGRMRLPHRWLLVASLGLAMLAARGGRDFRWLAAGLVLCETLLFGVPVRPTTPVAPPAVDIALDGPVLDLPARTLGDDARGRYLVWQRSHRQPVPYALLMQGWSPTLAAEPLMVATAALDGRDPLVDRPLEAAQFRQADFAAAVAAWQSGAADPSTLEGAADRLRGLGFTTVWLHRDLLDADDADAIEALLVGLLGQPESHGAERLWRL